MTQFCSVRVRVRLRSCSAGRLARLLSARHSRVSAGRIAAPAPGSLTLQLRGMLPGPCPLSPASAAAAAAAPAMPNVQALPRRLRARLSSSSAVSAARALTCTGWHDWSMWAGSRLTPNAVPRGYKRTHMYLVIIIKLVRNISLSGCRFRIAGFGSRMCTADDYWHSMSVGSDRYRLPASVS